MFYGEYWVYTISGVLKTFQKIKIRSLIAY